MSKYIICCDFDGVLHSYTSGWKGVAEIPDPPVEGAFEWLTGITEDSRFELAVYSSRSKDPEGIEAMKSWLTEHLTEHFMKKTNMPERSRAFCLADAMDVLNALSFPTQKPAASMTIDDRAFHFCGEFPTVDWLLRFQPWTRAKFRSDLQYERPTPSRLEEIATALRDTPYQERDSADHAVGELLTEIYYLRGGRR